MMEINTATTSLRFFIGAMTPKGFKYYADNIYDINNGWIAYLIKSGSGTGKSTLIRKAIEFFEKNNLEVIRLLCSSDPSSFDGIIVPEIKTCLLDATAPHIIEPMMWGAQERIVHLGEAMNYDELYESSQFILDLCNQKAAQYERCRKFISTASTLLNDNRRMAAACTDAEKIKRLAKRIAARELLHNKTESDAETGGGAKPKTGTDQKFFLSAITPQGMITLHETIQGLCTRIYSIEDEHGASSHILLKELRDIALESGYHVISCPCPLAPDNKLDHLIIPEIGVGFTTSNQWQKVDFPVFRRIHATRFTCGESLKKRKHLFSFNRRAANELLEEAVLIVQDAKMLHESLERLYIPSMDWKKADEVRENLIHDFEKIIKVNVREPLSKPES